MATEPVRAGSAWLALREPADAEARSDELVGLLRPLLPPTASVVHDLGSGTGSTARWLAPRLAGTQHWVLHDRDAELLDLASAMPAPRSADGSEVTVETRLDDITRLAPGGLAGASLVTASALLDMFTTDELARFVAACAGVGCPVLVTLSVVGRVALTPGDPLDGRMGRAFDDHQRRTRPGGRLLGPDAVARAVASFREAGLRVVVRPSPWHLGPGSAALAAAWLDGWVGAAAEQDPGLHDHAAAYVRRRRAQLEAGALAVGVDHLDLLALPGRRAASTARAR
ncbi:class I SAM-dependent methyltransferase [Nocardioides sp. Soil805]|uniref:class I SAM-dependent methyltransferase n=1 Tax=Nocardioides sp. Soil805 TaxID=1736416 RepID=UPI000703A555|nr:class I SAM-dependent methyltransferase [Nocardioides sp. Soil805]KRF36094.1 trans-aconitate methyltransferase [Nocardioides sp. Soil805]